MLLSTEMQMKLSIIIPVGTSETEEQLIYREKIRKQQKQLMNLNKWRFNSKVKFDLPKLKSIMMEMNIERFGICKLDKNYLFEGNSLPITHKYGIIFAIPMSYDKMSSVPSIESATEIFRIYSKTGATVVELTSKLQELGIDAFGHHPLGDFNEYHHILIPPHAYLAGLGEQGRTGLFIDDSLGPLVRLGMVTTDVNLQPTGPLDRGINSFCQRCQYCIKYCPPKAIPSQIDLPLIGQMNHFTIDGERCIKYFEKHYGCGKCLFYCVLAKPSSQEIKSRMFRINQWYEKWVISGELEDLNQKSH